MMRNKKGFTLIEMVVVLAVIAILAAILTPTITTYIANARVRRAESDCKTIAGAIAKFNADVGDWPIWISGGATGYGDGSYNVLYSADGEVLTYASGLASAWATLDGTLDNQLNTNAPGYNTTERHRRWQGPYLPDLSEDPWGNQYLVNVSSLAPGVTKYAVFVLSAGPDEEVDTDYAQDPTGTVTLGDDDIWCRIR